jgi:hypothetical protein
MKGYTDRLMRQNKNVFIARIRLPITFHKEERNLVVKVE